MCPFIGRCTKDGCRRAHDFLTGFNRGIILNHRCEKVDTILLVKLLRLQSNGPTAAVTTIDLVL